MLRCVTPHSVSSDTPGVQQLTEDSLLFEGPRATYGRFRILHQIGAGSVGPVFRGEDSETRRPVVIKVIRVGLTPERVAVVGPALRALKERLVAHAALCPILETGVVDVEPFVVSPVIDGDSLDVALREYGPANMADAIPRLRTLADALDAAAALDVSHGSLHLRDIVVSVEATVLTGIGIAAVLERVGVRPPVRRPYCAPEVALGRGISPAADQYSLAAIAHEWLSGRRVSGSEGVHVPTSSPEGARALATVFGRALAVDAEARYPSATAFVEALADVADLVTPRTRTSRRKAPPVAPLLEFDEAAETPAFTFAAPESAFQGQPVATDAGEADENSVADSVALGEAGYDVARMGDLPLALGPKDLGEADAVEPDWVVQGESDEEDGTPSEAPPLPNVADSPDQSRESAGPPGAPSWAMLGGVLVVGALLALLGGRALLRWGTPTATSSPAAAGNATTAGASPAGRPVSSPAPAALRTTPAPAAPVPHTSAPAAARGPAAAPEPVLEATSESPAHVVTTPTRAATPRPAPAIAAPSRTPPAAPPAARAAAAVAVVQPGRLLVRSTPSGAEVFVNGERRGVSPLAIRDLPLGAYAVRVGRAGFEPAQQRVVLEAGRPARALEVTLVRLAPAAAASSPARAATASGTLLVESRPAGARVFVDGVDVGRTPVTVPATSAGDHAVRIELAGYLPISTTTRVEPGIRARLAVTLTTERPR